MTVSTQISKKVLNGNGVTTSFPFSFKFLKNSDIEVYITNSNGEKTDLVEGAGNDQYSLTGAGTESGNVIYPAGGGGVKLPAGWTITIQRNMPYLQSFDLTNESGLFLQAIEDAFDYVTMLVQQVYSRETFSALLKNSLNTFFDALGTKISNLGAPEVANDAVRLVDLTNLEQRFLSDSEVSFKIWNITGNDGTDYDIEGATTSEAAAFDVLLDKVRQRPELDYTIDIGSTPPQINFSSAVAADVNIYIVARGYNNQVIGGTAGDWANITGKPTTFPPSTHTHDYSGDFAGINHSHGAGDLPDASTSAKGVVRLSSATNSNSTELAATASAVKAAYDLAQSGGGSVPDGSTSVKGIVQLVNSVTSTSVTLVPTANALKTTYDLAASKASASHNHSGVYKPNFTTTVSTSGPSGGSDGDVWYQY